MIFGIYLWIEEFTKSFKINKMKLLSCRVKHILKPFSQLTRYLAITIFLTASQSTRIRK